MTAAVLGTLRVLADAAEHGLLDLGDTFDRLACTTSAGMNGSCIGSLRSMPHGGPGSANARAANRHYLFAGGRQFRISVIGTAVASATGWLIKNRPSRATAYCGRL